jgi:hypothetical protein
MVRKLAVLLLLLSPLSCGDDDAPTGPAQIPDVTGVFAGRLSMTMLDEAVTLRCNVSLDIEAQTGSDWDGVIRFTQSNELCTAGETDAVSGTIAADREVTMTLDDSDLAEGCTTFSGSKVFTGTLTGEVLTVSTSITCDDVSMDIELTGTRS